MIKMIVSDVDGTLLSHGYINPKCIESIKKAQDKGVEFVVASGRDYYGITSVLDPLDIKCSAILGNGAQYCNKEGKVLMDCYLNKKKLKTIGVIGPNANSREALIGNYHGTASRYVTVLEGIQD